MINKLKSFLLPFQFNVLCEGLNNCRLVTFIFLISTFISSLCVVSGPFIFSYSIEKYNDQSANLVFLCLLLYSLSVAAIRCLQDVKMILCNRIEQEVRFATEKKMFDKIINANPDLFVKYNPSKISSLLQGIHQSNKIYIQLFLMVILGGMLDIVFSFILIGKYINWIISLFVVIYGVFVIFLTLHSNKITTHHQKNAQDKFNESSNLLGNIFSNIVSIKVFLGQDWAASLYERYNSSSKKSWVKFYNVRLSYSVAQSVLLLVQYLMIFAIILWVNNTGGKVNQLVMISMVLMQLNRPFEMIGSSLRDFIIARGMAEPTQTMLNNHCPEQDIPQQNFTYKTDSQGGLPVELCDVSFRYSSSDTNCLNNISAVFNPGKINFIMGPSGAGKSTLMFSMLGMQNLYTGSVLIAGRDLKKTPLDSHLKCTGYVPQDAMMMNLSVRENILIGRNYSDEDIMSVLNLVHLREKILSLPGQLDFLIGERGVLLSGGERQRLAIARALIGKPKLLLLDEVTSALDEPTEFSIFSFLRTIVNDTTIIAITHRPSVIQDEDFVLHLKGG